MNIETKLIKCKMELDKIALRDPITVQQVSIRKLWERVRSILVKRYKRLEDQEKKMKKYESKEKLLKNLNDINWNYFYEVANGVADGDVIGLDGYFYSRALRYVPNKVLRKWIKEIKNELKKQGEKND